MFLMRVSELCLAMMRWFKSNMNNFIFDHIDYKDGH